MRKSQVHIGLARQADDAAAALIGRSAELMLRVGRLMQSSRELTERAEHLRKIFAAHSKRARSR